MTGIALCKFGRDVVLTGITRCRHQIRQLRQQLLRDLGVLFLLARSSALLHALFGVFLEFLEPLLDALHLRFDLVNLTFKLFSFLSDDLLRLLALHGSYLLESWELDGFQWRILTDGVSGGTGFFPHHFLHSLNLSFSCLHQLLTAPTNGVRGQATHVVIEAKIGIAPDCHFHGLPLSITELGME